MSSQIAVAGFMESFRAALQSGIEGIVRASEIYVAALDEDPRNADRFRDEFSELVPVAAWAQFEAVGRKWMHPRLLLGGVADRKKAAMIKRMPYSMQERVFKHERFPLLTERGETLELDIMEATTEQAEQLCERGTIRTLSEQRAWMESRQTYESREEVDGLPYVVQGKKVLFRRGCVMSRAELRRLVEGM